MLLAGYQHRFERDLETMSRHLIDDVTLGWEELGTDLLDGAPPALARALTAGEHWPSRQLDRLITADGSPPIRMTVTEETVEEQDLHWGYVLRQQGIEVISLLHPDNGPVVGWDTDPSTAFSDHPAAWPPPPPAPARQPSRNTPPRSAPVISPTRATTPRPATRR
ncbi:hypothetical protein [Streptomyces buecherae]|uniref:hypothetical protein n=1 Tax=Streptomyces buecherae TaxID=2763006 RepID=UPI003648AACC